MNVTVLIRVAKCMGSLSEKMLFVLMCWELEFAGASDLQEELCKNHEKSHKVPTS